MIRISHINITVWVCWLFTCGLLVGCGEQSSHSDVKKVVANEMLVKEKTKRVSIREVSPPTQLTVGEGFINPLGYYESRPRFSWKIPQNSSAQYQSAYQIQVASSPNFKLEDILWDSNKVISQQNAWLKYQGPKLHSRQKVYWRVAIWDEFDEVSNWSKVNFLELGLIDNDDWVAQWIGHPDMNETDNDTVSFKTVKGGRFPAPNNRYFRPQYLRTDFELTNKVAKARLYITSKGVFKPFINGVAVAEDVMTPGWTPYHKRIETLTYDVTDKLKLGENALGAILAEGWHSGRIFHPTEQQIMLPMRLIAQLEVTYLDGTKQIIYSNEHWKSSNQGPIREASNYDGEYYDANFEKENWHSPGFLESNWQAVVVEPIERQVALKPKRHVPVRATKTIPAVSIVSQENGVVIFDMGQNMVGVPAIHIPVIANQTVRLRFAEALNQNKFAVDNLRSAKNTDYYIPKQSGVIHYQPTFTFHGYRFVELSGFDSSQAPSLDWLEGKVLHSDFTVYQNFNSNNQQLNNLSNNVSWGLRGNFLDIPTDCPQRDERLGWTGDAQVFVETSLYKADVYGFWAAWLESVREDQGIDGLIPNYVPFRSFLASHTGAAWGDAATIVPWQLYQYTGDKNVLDENYVMMKRWLDYHIHHSYQFISTMKSHGDWLQPFTANGSHGGDTHKDLIATAYFAHSANIVAKSARILGYSSDADQYDELFTNIRQRFRGYFFDEQLNLNRSIVKPPVYKNGSEKETTPQIIQPKTTQTSYLLPLAFDLFEDNDQELAAGILVGLIKDSDNHLRTGFLGTPLLAPVLQKFNRSDLMYEMLFKQSYPSWFYSINHGATTTWERWDSYNITTGFNGEKMNSLNHYAYGAVASWFYTGMLGIQSLEPGFKRFEINPQFNQLLNQVEGSVPTNNGDIKVSWSIEGNLLTMSVLVPKNTEATLRVPNVSQLNIFRNGVGVGESILTPGLYQIEGLVGDLLVDNND